MAKRGVIGWGVAAAVGIVLVVLVGRGMATSGAPTGKALAAAPGPGAATAMAPTSGAVGASSGNAAVPSAMANLAPDGKPLLTPEQWAQLQQALKDNPQRDAEMARILGLLAFQRDVAQWRTLRQNSPTQDPQLQALAQRIDAGIDARVAQKEATGAEALALKASVLEVLQPDAQTRQAQWTQWAQGIEAQQRTAPDPRDAAFVAAQNRMVAQWAAAHPGQQPDAQWLAQLEQLRVATYSASSPNQE